MPKSDLKGMSVSELKQLRKDVDAALIQFNEQKRREALDAAEAAVRPYGFSLADLLGKPKKKTRAAAKAKYRHPENPALIWGGMGRKPKWFKEAIEAGASKESMQVD